MNYYNLTEEEQKLLSQYLKTKDKNLRNIFVLKFMPVAEAIAKKYSKNGEFDLNEVESYAYEGLIKTLENYEESHSYAFNKYLYISIDCFVSRGLVELKYGKLYMLDILKFIEETIEFVEFKNGNKLNENVNLVNEVMELLSSKFVINNPEKYDMIKKFILKFHASTNEMGDFDLVYKDDYSFVYNNFIKDTLKQAIKTLKPTYQNLINNYYNLGYTVDEANLRNTSRQAFHVKKDIALEQLKNTDEIKYLKKVIPFINGKDLSDIGD